MAVTVEVMTDSRDVASEKKKQLAEELQLTPTDLQQILERDRAANPRAMFDRMNGGQLYQVDDPVIREAHLHGKSLAQQYNRLDFTDMAGRERILTELLGTYDPSVTLIPDIFMDYGHNIHFGRDCFVNTHGVFLDICPIVMGEGVLIGPNAQLLAALHPMENHQLRRAGYEYGGPITIGDNTWLGGGVTVCPGVTIGANSVIGTGSVVTRDVPEGVVAVGTPARVVREL